MTIISALPNTLTNGSVADATQVMADFNQIVNQVNANALGLATVTTKGDLIVGTAAAIVARLGVGSDQQRLVADSTQTTGLKYVADTTNYVVTTKGDLLVATSASTISRHAAGADNTLFGFDSTQTDGTRNFAASTGVSISGGNIAVSLTSLTASLAANVALNNTANYFDGPSVAQGTSGTWFASGTVTIIGSSSDLIAAKLWDGTTVIDSARTQLIAANQIVTISLSGILTSPTGNIRISVRDENAITANIIANATGNSKDSTITAFRLA